MSVTHCTKMKFSIKDFFSKCYLRIWSHLLKKSLMEIFIFCAVPFCAVPNGKKSGIFLHFQGV